MADSDRSLADGIATGDVLQMTSWHHIDRIDGKRVEVNFKVPRRGMTAMFLYIGARDERTEPFATVDLVAAMNRLGWYQAGVGELRLTASVTNQRDLLAQALGKLLVAQGMVRPDAQLTGPELLLAADTAIEGIQQHKEAFDGFNG